MTQRTATIVDIMVNLITYTEVQIAELADSVNSNLMHSLEFGRDTTYQDEIDFLKY